MMFVTILDPFGNLVKQFFDSRNMSHKGFCELKSREQPPGFHLKVGNALFPSDCFWEGVASHDWCIISTPIINSTVLGMLVTANIS